MRPPEGATSGESALPSHLICTSLGAAIWRFGQRINREHSRRWKKGGGRKTGAGREDMNVKFKGEGGRKIGFGSSETREIDGGK
ncbi:hypothetical protein RRG08_044752 [Elysia crispata]|uniref:Uncharacterized protein n=1 Tax=Elysia crispata TaxID=231223 RepID=A0AAE0ZJF2_9GAST|nr:hypothetical protein RRG08_044752 [Elysia crispata]